MQQTDGCVDSACLDAALCSARPRWLRDRNAPDRAGGEAGRRVDRLQRSAQFLAVGKFDNRSSYLRGIFSDGVDRLGGQAKTILVGHLQETGRFNVLDRDNMQGLAEEAQLAGQNCAAQIS